MMEFNGRPLPVVIDLPVEGLLSFINQFGDLWIGSLSEIQFKEQFNIRKQELLDTIVSYTNDNRCDNIIVDANFKLSMIQKSLDETWRHPGFMYYDQPPVTGNSRLLASGIGHQTPWQDLKFLVFAPKNAKVTQINNPTKIASDKELWAVVGIDKNPKDLITQILLDIPSPTTHSLGLDLVFINHNLYQKNQIIQPPDYVRSYQLWQEKYGNGQSKKPNIGIITDWPNQITDTTNHWDATIIGPSYNIRKRIASPGNLENEALTEHSAKDLNFDHVLWVISPRKIDLSEFLFWVNLENTTYIDQHWNFILYRKDQNYKSQYVSLSDF